jgi:hypothetical protein
VATGDVVRAIVAIVLGVVWVLVGLALATNFRGVTEWHIRAAARSVRGLERIPPWRWLRLDPETQVRRGVKVERLFGFVIAATGSAILVIGAVWLLRLLLG